MEQTLSDKSPVVKKPRRVKPENGQLTLDFFLAGEQEHLIILEEVNKKGERRSIGNFHIYTVKSDILSVRPFKGDFHMHSYYSDGVETPAYVAGACRRVGLDFMALTDHKRYAPSREAMDAFKDLPVDLRIYPGEEVHTPDNPVHVIAFGHSSGIAELYLDEAENKCRAEVAEILKGQATMPGDVNPFNYASCKWATDRIHERGGLAMLCHPYWVSGGAHNVAEGLLGGLFSSGMFDMFELVSGNSSPEALAYDANTLQTARFWQGRAEGLKIPVCGISDSHGCEQSEMFGRNFTIAFAPTPDFADISSAIKNNRCVAVEIMRGERPQAYGDFRLVKYAMFLLREIIPQHDELCYEEGRLMIRHAAGDSDALDRLKACQGQTTRLYENFWQTAK